MAGHNKLTCKFISLIVKQFIKCNEIIRSYYAGCALSYMLTLAFLVANTSSYGLGLSVGQIFKLSMFNFCFLQLKFVTCLIVFPCTCSAAEVLCI